MARRLEGKRVVITQASTFMGPAIAEVFSEEGADVIADDRDLTRPTAAQHLINDAGKVDVLIANLAGVNELLSKVGDGGFQAARSISFSPSLNLTPSTISARR